MACEFIEMCSFFSHEVGYSPELWKEMQAIYCFGDASRCARLEAMSVVPAWAIPADLMPSEHDRIRQLGADVAAGRLTPIDPGARPL